MTAGYVDGRRTDLLTPRFVATRDPPESDLVYPILFKNACNKKDLFADSTEAVQVGNSVFRPCSGHWTQNRQIDDYTNRMDNSKNKVNKESISPAIKYVAGVKKNCLNDQICFVLNGLTD